MSTYKLNKGVVDNLESSLSGKSSTDLDNLSNTGESHFANPALTNSPYTTNRILEIPQDIKLELNNGTLTLKAGSKVYVPNGAGVFDVITTSSDLTKTLADNGIYLLMLSQDGSFLGQVLKDYVKSGSLQTGYTGWLYNTSDNIIAYYNNGVIESSQFSLPLCIFTVSNGVIVSIDQIFNGFGYIGGIIFALPGVKVQTPNGRNEDGTYKSVIRTIDSVRTFDAGAWGTRNLKIIVSGDTINTLYETQAVERFTYNKQFSSDTTTYSYDENTGWWWYSPDQSSWVKSSLNIIGSCRVESGKITSFEPYTVDSIVNSNEFYQLKDKAVTTDTDQTISGSKRFTQPAEGMSIEFAADTNQQMVPAESTSRQLGLYRNATYTKGDGFASWIQGYRGSDGLTATEVYARRFLESDSQEIVNYLRVNISPDGTPVSYTRTPPAGCVGEEIVTAGWFRQSGCAAKTVIETYRNGTDWYRRYSDGWIEQGSMGVSVNATAGSPFVINYFIPFSVSDNQMIIMTPFEQDSNDTGSNLTIIGRAANNFTGLNVGFGRNPLVFSWYACGY